MKRTVLIFLAAALLLAALCGCGKPDRTKYDDGPAIDNGTYGLDENSTPAEGDPYAASEIGPDFALDMLRRHYGYYDSELKKYTEYVYAGDALYEDKDCYLFNLNVCEKQDGDYEPYGKVYYAKDGSAINIIYNKAEQ